MSWPIVPSAGYQPAWSALDEILLTRQSSCHRYRPQYGIERRLGDNRAGQILPQAFDHHRPVGRMRREQAAAPGDLRRLGGGKMAGEIGHQRRERARALE